MVNIPLMPTEQLPYNTHLMASFRENLGKPVPEWQTIRDSTAATDDEDGSGVNQNSLRCA